ncbi:MAG: alpha-2-macroglobulin, partial [Anaerolineae bacterium]|nr:alpha-2-macroglobulin [Anaerolineae bacterium]
LIRSSTWLWVSDTDYVSWRRENNDRITLVSDKSSYVPGETAEILIPTPFAGPHWAWITIERGSVLQHEVVALTTNSTVYRLPIRAEHAPNIYVSVVIVKGPDTNEPVATHKVGYIELSVEPATQLLQIELTPSVNQALPGETVSFDVVTRDAHGEPVQAGLSLDLVDKSVLSLSPRQPNAILEAFYGRRGLGISTASGLAVSINRLLQEQIEELDGLDMEAENGIGGGAAFDEQAVEAAPALEASKATVAEEANMAPSARETGAIPPGLEIREDFADTAYWNATITTDRTGHASVDVQLPDNLTTWELRGVGITAQTQLGEATTDLLVTKPLLVRPVTPRFFVVDDRVKLAALISNNTGVRQDVEVTLSATGLTLEDPAKQTIAIPQGREGRITWWASVEDTPSVDLAIRAVAGDYSDAARPRLTTGPNGTLMVYRYTAPEIVGTGGQLVGDESRAEVIALPPRYDDRRGELSVRLDPSLAAGMQESLDYLEHFPYECTEQTVSRFLPNVLTYRALHELGISNADLEAKLPRLVEEGVTKLALEQHGDGGWGWWYDGESNPYLTAYVVFALVKARDADFAVPGAVIEQGLNYLSGTLVGARDLRSYREANQQAFTLYVLTEADQGRLTMTYLDDLYRRRDRLSHYGRAYLAMALHLQATGIEARDSRINTLLSDVQNAAILSATGAHWEEDNYDWWAMNTDTRSTAIILDALTLIDPDGGLLPQVVRWLMIARRDGIWETTQETAWALIALTDWMSVTGELQGQYEYGVQLNGDLLTSGSVTPENIDESVSIKSAIAVLLADASNELVFARGAGSGRLYYTAHLEIYLPAEEVEPLNRGIIVTRQYHEPTCTSGPACPQVNQADVGDVIQVHLTIVAPHDLYYVVIEDPLPAGTEAIDTALDTSSIAIEEPGLYRSADDGGWSSQYYWWWRWYSRSEMRDEKVVLFADYLPAGTYEYTYSFRATQAGVYQVIPTSAHEFYFPEVFGRGAGRIFTVSD